jgi:hypothetical protein
VVDNRTVTSPRSTPTMSAQTTGKRSPIVTSTVILRLLVVRVGRLGMYWRGIGIVELDRLSIVPIRRTRPSQPTIVGSWGSWDTSSTGTHVLRHLTPSVLPLRTRALDRRQGVNKRCRGAVHGGCCGGGLLPILLRLGEPVSRGLEGGNDSVSEVPQ